MFKLLRYAFVASILWIPFGQIKAALINAKSVSLADVSSAIASAHDGDAVVVPPGTASWTSTLIIAKGITLQGAGNDATVILDDLPRPERGEQGRGQRQAEGPGQRQTEESGQRQLERQRQQQLERQRQQQLQGPRGAPPFPGSRPFPGQGGSQGRANPGIMRIELTPRQSFRLTGFTFRYGTVTSKSGGAIRLSGTCPSIRVDHCHFDQLYTGNNVQIVDWLYGVIDHCVFDMRPGGNNSVFISHETWGNKVSGWGSWAEPPYFGSEKFVFVEDNIIHNQGTGANNGTIDGQRGARFVVRHNTFDNCTIFYHGTDSGSGGLSYRGTRAVEIYNNTFKSSLPNNPGGQNRGGSLLWHDNKYVGTIKNGMALKIYRLAGPLNARVGWQIADGTSPWDVNDTEGNGTNVPGHRPHLYATGKATETHPDSSNSTTDVSRLVVKGAGWTTDKWKGYSVINTTTNVAGYITSNTSDTISYTAGSNAQLAFSAGDEFAIYKVLIVLDQPGRGQGDLIQGAPNNPVAAWPHQALEPCYSWGNTLNGSNLDFAHIDANDPLREGVDFYNNTPMPGYKPYAYPHPLIMGSDKPSPAQEPKN